MNHKDDKDKDKKDKLPDGVPVTTQEAPDDGPPPDGPGGGSGQG